MQTEPIQTRIEYPEPPAILGSFNLKTALAFFGPGAIMASITIGSGETVFASRGGAVFGYTILWAFVLGAIMKGALVYSGNRYITLTGEHPMARWAEIFPGPRGWFPLLLGILSILSFPAWEGGLTAGLGDLARTVFGFGEPRIWGTVFLLSAAGAAWAGGYSGMEKAQIGIVGFLLIAVLVGVVVARPDWLAVLVGSFVPSFPVYDSWVVEKYASVASRPVWVEVVTYLGAIGGGTYDYIGYTGMLREKRWGLLGRKDIDQLVEGFLQKGQEQLPLPEDPAEVKKALTWTRAPLGDVLISFGSLVIFTIGFMVNGANILHGQQLIPAGNDLLIHQAQFLTVIHPTLEYLWYLAAFVALWGTAYGVYEGYSFTTYETLGAVFPKIRRAGITATRRWVYLYVTVGGLLLLWTGWNMVTIVTPASIVGGVLTGGLWCLAMVWTEKRMLPAPYRMSGAGRWLLLISGVVLTTLGLISVLQYLKILP